jgi:hypothetical protein
MFASPTRGNQYFPPGNQHVLVRLKLAFIFPSLSPSLPRSLPRSLAPPSLSLAPSIFVSFPVSLIALARRAAGLTTATTSCPPPSSSSAPWAVLLQGFFANMTPGILVADQYAFEAPVMRSLSPRSNYY